MFLCSYKSGNLKRSLEIGCVRVQTNQWVNRQGNCFNLRKQTRNFLRAAKKKKKKLELRPVFVDLMSHFSLIFWTNYNFS